MLSQTEIEENLPDFTVSNRVVNKANQKPIRFTWMGFSFLNKKQKTIVNFNGMIIQPRCGCD